MLSEQMKHVAVIGAGGKMGRGIALLVLQQQAADELSKTGAVGSGVWTLTAVDQQLEALRTLRPYLRTQMLRWAEKNINSIRRGYANNTHLIDNTDMITTYVNGAMDLVVTTTQITDVAGASLVFEAVIEDFDAKTELYKTLKALPGAENSYYLTNTSSIPISAIDAASGLDHRIIGFHFYNPPPMQRLVEVITNDETDPRLQEAAQELGRLMGKTLVPSRDVAGFIGNGHFLREVAYACRQVERLSKEHGEEAAICIVNAVTQHYLVRPMGVFQLLDYVGIDIACKILKVMRRFSDGTDLDCPLLERFLEKGIRGGQLGDGSQRDGIFQYDKGQIAGVYSLDKGTYVASISVDKILGPLPDSSLSWKAVVKDPKRDTKLASHFQRLFGQDDFGATLAQDYLKTSRSIAENLVSEGVASNLDDVNTVLVSGFAHAYGPHNSYY